MLYPNIEIANFDDGSVYFILLDPVVKSLCCFDNCHFSSIALISSRISNSFESHLFTRHNLIANIKWKCTSCNVELTSQKKRFHSCPPNTSPTILIPNSTSSLQSYNTSSTLNSLSLFFIRLPILSSPISNSLPVINSSTHYISCIIPYFTIRPTYIYIL